MIEEMLTMRPYLRPSMWRPTSRASMNCETRSVSIAERKVSVEVSTIASR